MPKPSFKPNLPNSKMIEGLLWTMQDGFRWAQTVQEVQIVFNLPEGTRGRMIDCKFTTNSIKFGLKGQTPLLEGQTDYTIKPNESTWSIDPDSGEATVILVKAVTHENWKSVIKGVGVVDFVTSEEMGKKMLLEKFTAENPGFDFSGATFNGRLPADPKNFCSPGQIPSGRG